jgi:tetratricopeptide (TPR) repeat protein
VIELEAMVADRRHHEAINLGLSMLDRGFSAFQLGRVRYFLGQAYLGASQPDNAAGLLAAARTHFEAIHDGVMLAECIGAQASLATMTQAKDAVMLAEMALTVCRALKPVPAPTEARLLGILGAAHAADEDSDRAIAAYREAVAIGGTDFDLRGSARAYSRLGLAYHENGDVETAARYAMRAAALFEVLRDRATVARALNNLGQVFMARGDYAEAREHLESALELCAKVDCETGRSKILLSVCELAIHQGDVDRAHELASEALELAGKLEEGPAIAEAHVWLGRIADRRGDNETADREFADAIGGFEALGLRERLLQCHGQYAEILERRGELSRAYVHMKEALQASRPGLLRRDQEQEQDHVRTA